MQSAYGTRMYREYPTEWTWYPEDTDANAGKKSNCKFPRSKVP